jgi:hypothetical protein
LATAALSTMGLMSLSGCAAINGFPDAVVKPSVAMPSLDPYLGDKAVGKYTSCIATDSRESCRNEIVEAQIYAVNQRFEAFERALFGQGVGFGVGTDWAVLALNSVGAVTSASKPLSAAAAALVGAKASYEKEALFNQTLPVLMAQMVARRREVLARIRSGHSRTVADYSLFAALNDLDDYRRAGTIPGAMTEMIANTGVQTKDADAKLDALSVVTPNSPDVQARIEAIAARVKAQTDAQLNQFLLVSGKTAGVDPKATALLLLSVSAASPNDLETYCVRFRVVFAGVC